MKLYLDLSVSRVAKVKLFDGEKIVAELEGREPLPLIDQLLTQHKLKLTDLEEIDSFPGPGSYTGLRIGAAVANTLNYSLGKEKQVKPIYEANA